MRNEKIDEIILASSSLSASIKSILDFFNSSTEEGELVFDVKRAIHGSDLSFADCSSRIFTVDEIVAKFQKTSNHIMVPLSRLNQLKQSFDDAQTRLDALSNQFRTTSQNGGGQRSFNYDNFHLQNLNGQNNDLRAAFKNFADGTEGLLEAFYRVLIILRPTKATYSFQAAANALTTLLEDISEEMGTLQKESAELRKTAKTADQIREQTQVAADETNRLQKESEKERRTIGEYLADATEKKTSIDSVHADASGLEADISDYSEKFEIFDRQLEARNKDFEAGRTNQTELFAKFDQQKEEVQGLIEQSESMLKGATVAGLASSFSEAHKKLGWQLFWARVSFYVGILFLFISAVPLMLYVFLPILAPVLKTYFPEMAEISNSEFSNAEVTGWQYLGQVLARFVILLPAAWFVSFSAIRHSSLFRLREHYAYKYSMAVSVEGFRKQAQGYENEVAALVLEQLAFNPADKLTPSKDVPEGRVPHPILDMLVSKMRTRINKDEN